MLASYKILTTILCFFTVTCQDILRDSYEPIFLSRDETYRVVRGDSVILPCQAENLGESGFFIYFCPHWQLNWWETHFFIVDESIWTNEIEISFSSKWLSSLESKFIRLFVPK